MLIVKKTLLTMLIGLVLAGCSAVPSQTPTIYPTSPSQTPTLYPADSSNAIGKLTPDYLQVG
jgi:uncharacterized protein YceK